MFFEEHEDYKVKPKANSLDTVVANYTTD